jgi:hypothetical protein
MNKGSLSELETIPHFLGALMPRYFFDTYDGRQFVGDDVGLELESLGAAKAAAQKSVVEMAQDELPDGDRREFVVSVKDEDGVEVLKVSMAMAVEKGDGGRLNVPKHGRER